MGTKLSISDRVDADFVDHPVFYPETDKRYFGIISEPVTTPPHKTAVVLMSGTYGGTTTLGRNRIWLRMARSLASRGYRVLRFDYAGLGDSVGEAVCYELEKPAVAELKAGFDLMTERGAEDFIVVGTCYGSRSALVGSAGDNRVRGVHLLVPPIGSGTKGTGGAEHLAEYVGSASLVKKAFSRRVLKRLWNSQRARDAARRVVSLKTRSILGTEGDEDETAITTREAADDFRRPLRQLLEAEVPVHMLFGTEDFFWTQFNEARNGRLGDLLEQHRDLVEVETVPGIVRGFLSTRVQDAVINSVVEWVDGKSK